MSTADKLNKLLETKEAIKQAIIDKGGTVGDVFAEYPTAIQNIQGGGGSGKFVVPTGMRFAYSAVEEFPEDWDWSEFEEATSTSNLFNNCRSLKTIPKLKFNNLQDTQYMFHYAGINEVDTSEWDTSNLQNASNMFNYSNITKVPQMDFSNAANLSYLFGNCSITEANINTDKAGIISNLFNSCKNLHTVSEINTSNVTSNVSQYSSPFYTCYALRNFGGFKGLKVNMYIGDCRILSYESLMNVINKLADGVSGKTLYLHQDCVNQLSDDDIAIATSKGWSISPARTITEPIVVTNLNQIPSTIYQITPRTYDFSQYSGSWVESGSSKSSLLPCDYSINVFEADLSSSTDLSYMFGNTNVIYVKLTNVRPTKMRGMFFSSDLSEIDLSGFDTSAVADMAELFYASNISSIDFSGLDFSNVTNLHSAFAQTPITSVDLSVVDTSKVIHMSDMFSQCKNLKSVVLGDLSSVEYITSVFANCTSLESVTMKGPISENADFGSYPFAGVNTTGTFYYNPAYDYSNIIAKLPATWTAVPLTE